MGGKINILPMATKKLQKNQYYNLKKKAADNLALMIYC